MAPKKNKQQPHNAFYFYMLEVKKNSGSKTMSMEEASRVAGQTWPKMNAQQRAPYEQMAKSLKNKASGERYTTQGVSFSQLDRDANESKKKSFMMQREITETIKIASMNNALADQDFYVVDINIFCETPREYVPAELAVVCFNLRQGVYRVHHTLINPEIIPTGYRSEAMRVAEETHQLRLPPDALGESGFYKIYTDLITFIRDDIVQPPVYTIPKSMQLVEGVLTQFCDMLSLDSSELKVYNLADLFYQLSNACVEESGAAIAFVNNNMAELELMKDTYDFYKGLSCEFHETTDAIAHCSLSKVKRYCYLMADFCCQHLGIELIPGKHIPQRADASKASKISEYGSVVGSRSSSRAWSDISTSSTVTSVRSNARGRGKRNAMPHDTHGRVSPTMSLISSLSNCTVGDSVYEDADSVLSNDYRLESPSRSEVSINSVSEFDFRSAGDSSKIDEEEGATGFTLVSSKKTNKLRRPNLKTNDQNSSAGLRLSGTTQTPAFAAGRGVKKVTDGKS